MKGKGIYVRSLNTLLQTIKGFVTIFFSLKMVWYEQKHIGLAKHCVCNWAVDFMNGYELSLRHYISFWCVCLVICNVIQSHLPNYITTSDKGPYVLLPLSLYSYSIAVRDVWIHRDGSRNLQALPSAVTADRWSPFVAPKLQKCSACCLCVLLVRPATDRRGFSWM